MPPEDHLHWDRVGDGRVDDEPHLSQDGGEADAEDVPEAHPPPAEPLRLRDGDVFLLGDVDQDRPALVVPEAQGRDGEARQGEDPAVDEVEHGAGAGDGGGPAGGDEPPEVLHPAIPGLYEGRQQQVAQKPARDREGGNRHQGGDEVPAGLIPPRPQGPEQDAEGGADPEARHQERQGPGNSLRDSNPHLGPPERVRLAQVEGDHHAERREESAPSGPVEAVALDGLAIVGLKHLLDLL